MSFSVIFILWLEILFAAVLLRRADVLKTRTAWVVAVTLLLVAFAARLLALRYETLDYKDFLSDWVQYYRSNGGLRALGRPVGNYNVPYLFLLALFSYSSIPDLYLIKLCSIFFDVVAAWGAMRLVSRFTENPLRRAGTFFAVLYLPTVFLNGAFWGQCDVIYAAFLLHALADGLEGRSARCVVFLALAFGFKLQAIFVMPVFALLLFMGKLRVKHLPLFPLTYVLLILPAVLAGRPFWETLTLYFSQTGSIGSGLNYNSSSVYALIGQARDAEAAASGGIFAAFFFILLLLCIALYFHRRLNDRLVLLAAVLFAIGVPFLLPHMHDRYFFAADLLTLTLAFAFPVTAPVAALTQFASLLGYYAYLVMRYLLLMSHGARALLLALFPLAVYFVHCLKSGDEPFSEEKTQPGKKIS